MRHPETELIPYLRGELPAEDRAAVSGHLRDCAACRVSLEEMRSALGRNRRAAVEAGVRKQVELEQHLGVESVARGGTRRIAR